MAETREECLSCKSPRTIVNDPLPFTRNKLQHPFIDTKLPTIEEVQAALLKLKINKAIKTYSIPPQLLKSVGS